MTFACRTREAADTAPSAIGFATLFNPANFSTSAIRARLETATPRFQPRPVWPSAHPGRWLVFTTIIPSRLIYLIIFNVLLSLIHYNSIIVPCIIYGGLPTISVIQ